MSENSCDESERRNFLCEPLRANILQTFSPSDSPGLQMVRSARCLIRLAPKASRSWPLRDAPSPATASPEPEHSVHCSRMHQVTLCARGLGPFLTWATGTAAVAQFFGSVTVTNHCSRSCFPARYASIQCQHESRRFSSRQPNRVWAVQGSADQDGHKE